MELYRDHFQNTNGINIPKAQLIIADILLVKTPYEGLFFLKKIKNICKKC